MEICRRIAPVTHICQARRRPISSLCYRLLQQHSGNAETSGLDIDAQQPRNSNPDGKPQKSCRVGSEHTSFRCQRSAPGDASGAPHFQRWNVEVRMNQRTGESVRSRWAATNEKHVRRLPRCVLRVVRRQNAAHKSARKSTSFHLGTPIISVS